MIPLETWLLFCLACVALAATPGPNMLFLVSRTLAQGRRAGFVSLAGTSTGFALHAIAAALGLSALLAAVPLAYDVVRFAGAIYLAWLAVVTWRAGADTDDYAPEAGGLEQLPQPLIGKAEPSIAQLPFHPGTCYLRLLKGQSLSAFLLMNDLLPARAVNAMYVLHLR